MIVLGKIEKMNSLTDWERELALLENKSNLRKLPVIRHLGREVEVNGKVMLNLSSNDYLGLAAYLPLRTEFLQSLTPDTLPKISAIAICFFSALLGTIISHPGSIALAFLAFRRDTVPFM